MGGTRRLARAHGRRRSSHWPLTAGVAATVSTVGRGRCRGDRDGKTGPQPPGLGLGSKAALAQCTCNETGHTNLQYKGDVNGPFCVNPWKDGADNGGATAPGVTKDDDEGRRLRADRSAARRAARRGHAQARQPGNGQPDNWQNNFRDFDVVYQYAIKTFGSYQTWGRHPVYEFVEASGTDEAAQRADVLAVIAKKPFLVIDAYHQSLGAPVFESEIAKAHIIVNGAAATSLSQSDLQKQAPYRWAVQSDSTASTVPRVELPRLHLGEKAQYAGDTSLQGKTRVLRAHHADQLGSTSICSRPSSRRTA